MAALIMVLSAAVIILLVKFGLLRGIDHIAGAMDWSAKARGQVIGYATSVPELVCLVAAGLAGVWEAGLWNIASSNIINGALMFIAVLYYRQFGDLLNKRFLDEVGFAAIAVAAPIALMALGMDTQWVLIPCLLGFFGLYRLVDTVVNRPESVGRRTKETVGSLPLGFTLALGTLIAMVITGIFLGNATSAVVEQLGVHPAIAGWLLGVVTSIPELVSFFNVYASASGKGSLGDIEDTQEALDNLTASNMANVGIVYPIGLLALLLATTVLGR